MRIINHDDVLSDKTRNLVNSGASNKKILENLKNEFDALDYEDRIIKHGVMTTVKIKPRSLMDSLENHHILERPTETTTTGECYDI